jgi:Na+/phosphate symporter
MTSEQAQSAVTLSAFLVAAIFAYRKLTEAPNVSIVPQTGHFVIGFGFTFVTLSLLAQAAPQLGGMMAVLVATGDLLANGLPLIKDLQSGLNHTATATKGG